MSDPNPFSQIDSPLSSANPKSTDELFNEDPEYISNPEFLKLINEYREQRIKYAQDEISGKTRGRKSKKISSGEVSLKSLGLDNL